MLKSDAIEAFGSASAVADALDISASAVGQWGEMVPPLSAARLAAHPKGVESNLKFDPELYADWNKPKKKAQSA